MPETTNRLAQESSAYLKSAAQQPVEWYPWGDEAFRKAKELDRPILLDIGASWCHWCHVIDRESYEDPETAKVINEHFVAIKVDRDERPDIDARYQAAVQNLSGQGGWPLTAFLTPDGMAFYGGTYFPPRDLFGRPGFRTVLVAVANHYRNNTGEARRDAQVLHQHLSEAPASVTDEAAVTEAFLREALDVLRGQFDPVNGGFGGPQKFPHPGTMEFLMARHHRTREESARNIVVRTLAEMAQGGVCDQIGGGFHRYSTDSRWIVPHFEKMLYDNAGLLANYVHAWQLFGDPLFKETAEDILGWLEEVLSDRQHGGYYASQDADVGLDDDGDYFTWTSEELKAAVPADEARVLASYYDVGERGEMHHDPRRNVLYVDKAPSEVAEELRLDEARAKALILSGRKLLKTARDRRTAPAVDKTIYASWNGMMASAALEAAAAFGRPEVRDFALKTLDRILRELWTSDRGMWHGLALGGRKVTGLLEDHVFVVDALLTAQTVTGDPAYRRKAEEIMVFTLKHFWDAERKGFADLAPDLHAGDGLPLREIRRRPLEDAPYAGANAVAALCLQKLHALTGNDDYRLHHDELVVAFSGEASRDGAIFAGTYHLAAELWLHPPAEVVILGPQDDPKVMQLREAASSTYSAGRTLLLVDGEDGYLPDAVGPMRNAPEAREGPVAFVCTGTVCSPPTKDPERLRVLLGGPSR
ncbi:MAG TPA: thioredoxin domain-containing protein [Thermoplasmata archaeon]|jgi:uncharacterized protein YyaL (SSP411 family)